MPYVTWEHYSSLFSSVTKEGFDRLAAQAWKRMDYLTAGRVERFLKSYDEGSASDFCRRVHDAVLFTLCELVEKLYLLECSGAGSGIASVSNAGYSESYRVATESERRAELDAVIRNGLSGTGLAGAL